MDAKSILIVILASSLIGCGTEQAPPVTFLDNTPWECNDVPHKLVSLDKESNIYITADVTVCKKLEDNRRKFTYVE